MMHVSAYHGLKIPHSLVGALLGFLGCSGVIVVVRVVIKGILFEENFRLRITYENKL